MSESKSKVNDSEVKVHKTPIKKLIIISLFAFVIFVTMVVGLGMLSPTNNQSKKDPNIVALVGDKKITKEDYGTRVYGIYPQGTIEKPLDLKDNEKTSILEELVEDKIIAEEAKKAGVSLDEKALIDRTEKEVEGFAQMTSSEKKAVLANRRSYFLKEKFKSEEIKGFTGQYLFFRFDKYYKYGDLNYPGIGEQVKIDEQKAYAQNLSSDVSSKLEKKEITFEQAIKTVTSDPIISAKAFEPLRPAIHGEINQSDYQEGSNFFDNNSYSGFTENVLKIKSGEISKPFLVKGYPTDKLQGEKSEILYALVKIDKTFGKVDLGSKTYSDWLEAKKKEYKVKIFYSNLSDKLKDKSYALSDIVSTAYAESADCWVTVGGTHRAALHVKTYYIGKSDGLAHPYGNALSTIRAGAGTARELNGASVGCGGLPYSYHEANVWAWNNGEMSSNLQGTTDYGWNRGYVVDCDNTSTSNITFWGDSPALAGTIPTLGGWYFVHSGFNAFGITGNADDSKWVQDVYAPGNDMLVKLDLGTTTSWANGSTVTKRGIFRPHWQDPPTVKHKSPANEKTFTLPTKGATLPMNFVAQTADGNNDTVSARAAYRKVDAAGNPLEPYNYTNWSGLKAPGSVTLNPTAYLTEGRYQWVVEGYDGHGTYNVGTWSADGSWYLNVVAPPASCTVSLSANPVSGQSPLTVNFGGGVSGAPTSTWIDFGDGTGQASPGSHTYTLPGGVNYKQYPATYRCTSAIGNHSQTVWITVTNSPSGIWVYQISPPDGTSYAVSSGGSANVPLVFTAGDTSGKNVYIMPILSKDGMSSWDYSCGWYGPFSGQTDPLSSVKSSCTYNLNEGVYYWLVRMGNQDEVDIQTADPTQAWLPSNQGITWQDSPIWTFSVTAGSACSINSFVAVPNAGIASFASNLTGSSNNSVWNLIQYDITGIDGGAYKGDNGWGNTGFYVYSKPAQTYFARYWCWGTDGIGRATDIPINTNSVGNNAPIVTLIWPPSAPADPADKNPTINTSGYGTTATAPMEAEAEDPDGDNVSLVMYWNKDGDPTKHWCNGGAAWVGTNPRGNCSTPLTAGKYWLTAIATDQYGVSRNLSDWFTVFDPPPTLTCKVYPQSATVPAVVDIVPSPMYLGILTATYDYDVNYGGAFAPEYINQAGKKTHTYSVANEYEVYARMNISSVYPPVIKQCDPIKVKIKDPNTKSGGEVSP